MPFKIVRNDITRMQTDAIVNTASSYATVGPGCDYAIYSAAGYDKLLDYRKEKVGVVNEGEAFVTPSFDLPNKCIIHVVSPLYRDGKSGEETLLRNCYQRALSLAVENGCRSISFPLISTGSFGYPKEEGLRIAIDEITKFKEGDKLLVYLVVYDKASTELGKKAYPMLEDYIKDNYERPLECFFCESSISLKASGNRQKRSGKKSLESSFLLKKEEPECLQNEALCVEECEFDIEHESKLNNRIKHMSDSFADYLLYLIKEKNMTNVEVYKRAIVDKKVFSKIRNIPDYHPQKMTVMCLCIGAKLNLDETKDLLARAGYALSPCDKTDIIFSYFIENKIYDMIELDIQLEEHGVKCLIS